MKKLPNQESLMIKVRVCILWLKAVVYSREAKTMEPEGMQGWKEKETQIKNIYTKNMFFTEPNKAFEEECRSTGQGQCRGFSHNEENVEVIRDEENTKERKCHN